MHNESVDTLFVGSTRLPIPLSIRLLVVLLMTMVIFTQNDLNVKISVFFMILMAIEKVTLARWTILILFLINTFL